MADEKITCSACGRSYPWKPDYAGRKVKCKCGNVFRMPEQPPGKEADIFELDDAPPPPSPPSYDELIGDEPASPSTDNASAVLCPECGADMPPDAIICLNCGYNQQTGQKIDTATSADRDEDDTPPPPPAASQADDAPAGGLKKFIGRFRKKKSE